jgi:xylulokinase
MSYLGVDIGTTGCKAVVFDRTGHVLSQSYCEYQTISPKQGWFELNSHNILTSCKKVIAQAGGQTKNTDPVAAIGISSQGEAFTLLDKNDKYLCNAMVSFDTRSQAQVEEFCRSFGSQKLYQITGHSAHTLFSLFKLLWIKQNYPKLFDNIRRFFCFGDLLTYELTGQSVISYNLAARTMLFDINHLCWSQEILYAIGIDKTILPKLAPSGYCVGELKSNIADELGLAKNVTVATGGHDQSCGALGVGVIGPGTAAYSIGTVECLTPAFKECILNKSMQASNLATYPYIVENLYTTVAFNMTGGNLLRWYRNNFGQYEIQLAQKTGKDSYDLLLKDIPNKPTSIMVLPHFTSTGTPYFNPSPAGAIIGLNLNTSKEQVIKAILEGLTYEIRLNLELLKKAGIDITSIRAFGGGAKSSAWMQIKTDILNVPITSLAVTEAGCLGAAMLAGKSCGEITSLADYSKLWVKPIRVYEPSAKNVEQYKERFEIYSKLYDTIAPLNEMIKKLK